jgi:hypothetical protein
MSRLPVVLISCSTFASIFQENGFEEQFTQTIYLDSGLHLVPQKLKDGVQQAIDRIDEPSLIVLGYGLCGNGLKGIKAGAHTLVIPRADDCIALLMGSRQRYLEMKKKHPGSYFLTKGWLESDATPLAEYKKTAERYGEEKAKRIMDLQYRNYSSLIFVAHREEDFTAYREAARPVAEYCSQWGMEYEEYLGSLEFIRTLIDSIDPAAEGKIADRKDIIVVPPGGEIKFEDFLGSD